MADFRKKFLTAVVGVIALASAYYAGLTRRPTYEELPPKAQQMVQEEHEGLESLINGAANEFKKGNLAAAIEKFRAAKGIIPALAKIDPKYREIQLKLDQYDGFLEAVNGAQNSLTMVRSNISKMPMPPTSHDIGWLNGFYPVPTGFVYLRELYLSSQTEDPELIGAAWSAHLQFLKEWQSTLFDYLKKLRKAEEAGMNGNVKKMLAVIEDSLLPKVQEHLGTAAKFKPPK